MKENPTSGMYPGQGLLKRGQAGEAGTPGKITDTTKDGKTNPPPPG